MPMSQLPSGPSSLTAKDCVPNHDVKMPVKPRPISATLHAEPRG